MPTGKKIKEERENKRMSQKELATKININISVMNRIENEERAIRDDELLKIAQALNVSTDYLLGNTPPKNDPKLTEKDKKDIAKQVEDMLDGLNTENALAFQLDGKPIDEEIRRILKNSLQNTLEFARLKAKEKYTPNKYKK